MVRNAGEGAEVAEGDTKSGKPRVVDLGAVARPRKPVISLSACAHVMPGNQRDAADLFARLLREASGA
jgi:hypothetical protein